MSSPLDACADLSKAAFYESIWVATIIPAAIPIVPLAYQGQGDPAKLWDAADGWKATIDELEKAKQKIDELARRVPEDRWHGDDRKAFEDRMRDYKDQIDADIMVAWTVAVALWILAVLIGVFIYIMFVTITLLTIFATAIVVAAGTIVGAPAALELEAEANQFAAMGHRIVSVGSQVITRVSQATAIIWGAMLTADIGRQLFNGNTGVGETFFVSVKNGMDDQLKGAAAFLQQKAFASLMEFGGAGTSFFGNPLYSRVGSRTALEGIGSLLGADDSYGKDGGAVHVSKYLGNMGGQYGTEDGDPSEGQKYVDKTTPHR
ncbi:hypothetical protein [Actinomadura gamaensis]|uniref:Uncharacterized protein n=1 Tax=Actinomadura gamaensis TaxID=1763541 RepID=A0ABV9UBD2_9ACTN